MPNISKPQAKLTAAAVHSADFAKRVGVPPVVAKEFNREDAKSGILRKKGKPSG